AERFKYKEGWFEEWRHRSVLRKAESRLARYTVANASNPELLSKENIELRLKEFYTSESAKQIGMHIQGYASESEKDMRPQAGAPWQSENSRYESLLREVQEKSDILAKAQYETRNIKAYLDKLSPIEATHLKIQLHASIFVAAYRDATTMTDTVSALDSAQPGMTQRLRLALTRQTARDLTTLQRLEAGYGDTDRKILRLRQRIVSITASSANRGLRLIDSMFHDQSVDRGALGVIQRRVPFAEEFVSANIRNLKFWPVAFTVSWAWSHFALGTGISYSFWVTAILTQGIFVMMPVQWLFRNFRMQEFKPYDSNKPGWSGVFHLGGKYSIAEVLGYGVTFFAIMPAVLLTTEVGRQLTEHIGTPVARMAQGISLTEVSIAALTGIASYIAGSKFYEKWKMKRTLSRLSILAPEPRPESKAETTRSDSLATNGVVRGGRCELLFQPAR
ncbi:MAG: hypothetical protein RBT63_01825, partial [Bdellovibrionales bacterium]|nr:hypothetical protein [Bdellovibrionales bacterium]